MSVAYLSNRFPDAVESYVWKEIRELRKRNLQVIACSVQQPVSFLPEAAEFHQETLRVFPLGILPALKAFLLLFLRWTSIPDLILRAVAGPEPWTRRLRCLAHTWLGAYVAVLLRGSGVRHIHVHHGYFASWAGMVAARLLGANFSLTLHGSDLLVRADYLDSKLRDCRFCVTVSEFNRRYILTHYPEIDARKVLVQRLGVDPAMWARDSPRHGDSRFSILSVGRLHPVKNHSFLVLACFALKARGVPFQCIIAGDGPERERLEILVRSLGLEGEVTLMGHVTHEQLPELYTWADVVTLTSHSEGLPVTIMEAMAAGRIVLAPAITGISEIVHDRATGFLYAPNCLEDFLEKLRLVWLESDSLDSIRVAARRIVHTRYNSRTNLAEFASVFLEHIGKEDEQGWLDAAYENSLLQQI